MARTWKVLNVSLEADCKDNYAIEVNGSKFEVRDYAIATEKTLSIIRRTFLICRMLSEYDIVLTRDYFVAFAINLRLFLTFCRTKHVTVGLNQSRRLLKTGLSYIDKIINLIFLRNDIFFVHSRHEIRLFSEKHQIPISRFCFVHWGFDLPQFADDRFAQRKRDYVCMIGRNNRDIDAFCRAVGELDLDGVLVVPDYQATPADHPPNIFIYNNLSMAECLSCIKYSQANLILLRDNERGAGHITAVAAMMLGTPQIVSDSPVLGDYFFDGYNCTKVPIGAPGTIADAIRKFASENEHAEGLATNGKNYAARWLTHRKTEMRIFETLHKMLSKQVIDPIDPLWLSERSHLITSGARDSVE